MHYHHTIVHVHDFADDMIRIGLTINSTETKHMLAGRDRGKPVYVCSGVVIDGNTYMYLK